MLLKVLNRINSNLFAKKGNIYQLDRKRSELILNKFKIRLQQKDDLFVRSFLQFQCHKELQGKAKFHLLSLSSILVVGPLILLLFFAKFGIKRNNQVYNKAVSTVFNDRNIPASLLNKYSIVKVTSPSFCLNAFDLKFILSLIKKFPFSYFFILKNVLKIAQYRYCIRKFGCTAFIVTSEYSFSSSIMTYYCEILNIKHINVMHGEKFFFIRDSFFSFHKCYVWDKHYLDLFCKLGASTSQFIIEKPPLLLSLEDQSMVRGKGMKYYLSGLESEDDILRIRDMILPKFPELIIRAHPFPIFSDLKVLHKYKIRCEDPSTVSIEDSIKSSEVVCSSYSTVLYQGSLMNRIVVIDDLIKPEVFNQLKDLDYIVFSKPHKLLSGLLMS